MGNTTASTETPQTGGTRAGSLEALYERWLQEVWSDGRYAVVDELFAADVVDHNALPGQPAGAAGQSWAARVIRDAFPDAAFTVDVVFANGDLVTGRWTMTGTNTGVFALFGLPPTGRPVTMSGQEIFRVRDGRIVEVWHAEDTGAMLSQLGLDPPQGMMRMAAKRSARRYRKERRKA